MVEFTFQDVASAGANRPVGANDQKSDEPPPRDEPYLEPVNGIVQPPVVPPPHRPGRCTNKLQYMLKNVVLQMWKHSYAWPFSKPVDAIDLNLPVRILDGLLVNCNLKVHCPPKGKTRNLHVYYYNVALTLPAGLSSEKLLR